MVNKDINMNTANRCKVVFDKSIKVKLEGFTARMDLENTTSQLERTIVANIIEEFGLHDILEIDALPDHTVKRRCPTVEDIKIAFGIFDVAPAHQRVYCMTSYRCDYLALSVSGQNEKRVSVLMDLAQVIQNAMTLEKRSGKFSKRIGDWLGTKTSRRLTQAA